MKKENVMKKQLIMMGLIITVVTSIFSIGGSWAVGEYKSGIEQKKLSNVSKKTDALILEVNTIKTENKARDVTIDDVKIYIKEDIQWKLTDAEWKGMMSEIAKSNLYYGKAENINKLMKLSEENKKNVSKKKYE